MLNRFSLLALALAFSSLLPLCSASTLEKVRAAQVLNCGVNIEEPEYTLADAHGNRMDFDQDLCKAEAVAVLGAKAKFVVKPFRDEASALAALNSGQVDLIASHSATFRTASGTYSVGKPVLFDYQGFLVDKSLGIRSAKDFTQKKVCFLIGTEIETQVDAFMKREHVAYIPGPFSEEGEMELALITHNCAAVTADVTQLAAERSAFKRQAAGFEILPDVIAMDPLAPLTRAGDAQWSAIVDATVGALIQAEALGITHDNLASSRESGDILVQRLLGTNSGWGTFLGVDDEWALRAISAVGNYGELFERTLGGQSVMHLDRGFNKLSSHGGLLYAYPMR